jgi:hypothetical protein
MPSSTEFECCRSSSLLSHAIVPGIAGFYGGQNHCKNIDENQSGLAEGVGFEPTDACTSAVFKTAAIDHSATLPSQHAAGGRDNGCASCSVIPAWPDGEGSAF